MKKIFFLILLILSISNNSVAENTERNNQLDKLFIQLKNIKDLPSAQIVENKIWKIWSNHPSNDRRGFRLSELLDQGSLLIDRRKLNKAYEIFTHIIAVDPNWS